jgi:nicotinamide mononucleotide transporter
MWHEKQSKPIRVRLDWIALAFSVIGIVLNADRNIWCWPVWLLSNLFWILYSVKTKQKALFTLWAVFSVFNAYGWWKWCH